MRNKTNLPLLFLFAACAGEGDPSVTSGGATQAKGAPLADSPGDDVSPVSGGGITYLSVQDGEKIIGTNDLTPVLNDGANVPAQYRPYVDAFGTISMGCTATHIGNGLVLTAGHCFGAGEQEVRDQACSDTVSWGVRKDKASYLTSKCTRILAMRQSNDYDYAIFRVDNVPPVALPVDANARPNVDTTITIFGHPQLRPLEWSKTCPLRPASDGGWGIGQFAHQCDTEPGSSGSTVLTAEVPTVIGIHDGGVSDGHGGGWNYATYLADTPLREFLNGGGGGGGGGNDQPTTLAFADFGHNQDRVLATLGTAGQTLSFTVASDTESGYDFVIVSDANGKSWRQSGKKSRSYGVSARLAAPVTVRFTSDYSVLSKKVELREITYR